MTFNKGQSEKYTKYHDQCLEELESAAEYEFDLLLVHLVRIQHLTQRIVDFNKRDQIPDELPGIIQTSASIFHAAFQTELERLESMLHPSLRANCKYKSQAPDGNFNLHEIQISLPPTSTPPNSDSTSPSFTTPLSSTAHPDHIQHAPSQIQQLSSGSTPAIAPLRNGSTTGSSSPYAPTSTCPSRCPHNCDTAW